MNYILPIDWLMFGCLTYSGNISGREQINNNKTFVDPVIETIQDEGQRN